MFQPLIAAASHALWQATLPSLGGSTKMLLETTRNNNQILNLILFIDLLCNLTLKKICVTYTGACCFLMIYSYKHSFAFVFDEV